MSNQRIREKVIKRYYREACRPFNVTRLSHMVVTSLFLGVAIGTVAFGYLGTLLNIVFMAGMIYLKFYGSKLIKTTEFSRNLFLLSALFDIYIAFIFMNSAMFMVNISQSTEFVIKDIPSVQNLMMTAIFLLLLYLSSYLYLYRSVRVDMDQIERLEKNKHIRNLGFISIPTASAFGLIIGKVFGGNKIIILLTFGLSAVIAEIFIALSAFYLLLYFRLNTTSAELKAFRS